MLLRKSTVADVMSIMTLITEAQAYFKKSNIDQWQNGYPNDSVILNDIAKGCSYVLIKDDQVVATTVISFEVERTYDEIHEGQWLSEQPYAVMHRVAVSSELKGLGLGRVLIDATAKMCQAQGVWSIKVDTHEDNHAMQRLLTKSDFSYCGVIFLEDGAKRLAFETLLTTP